MLSFQTLIEWVILGIEVLAIVIMVAFISVGTVRWLLRPESSSSMRIRAIAYCWVNLCWSDSNFWWRPTSFAVTLELTLMNLATLALLVLVRTALGWALTLEVEGRWPWQERKETVREAES